MADISIATEKKCQGPCGQIKPSSAFYVVPSYPDHLSRLCRPCNTVDTRQREYRRLLKRKGTDEIKKRITHYRMLADLMQNILDEATR